MSTRGLVTSFRLVQTTSNGVVTAVSQGVPAVVQPPVFWWNPLLREWEFLIDTRHYAKQTTYAFRITLGDASVIDFRFGLK